MEKLEGMVSDIVFKNEENGYTIAYLANEKDEITIGESYDVEAGDDVFIRTKYDNEQIDMLIFKQ